MKNLWSSFSVKCSRAFLSILYMLSCRYISAERYSEALDLLQSGACIQLEHEQVILRTRSFLQSYGSTSYTAMNLGKLYCKFTLKILTVRSDNFHYINLSGDLKFFRSLVGQSLRCYSWKHLWKGNFLTMRMLMVSFCWISMLRE